MVKCLFTFFLSIILSTAGAVDGDPKAGKRTFENKCGICHVVEAGASHTVGPNLHGLVGRPIGRAAGFLYSEPLARADEQWTEQRLNDFLTSPQKVFPGTSMPFQGLKSESDRQNLIYFLEILK